MIMKRLVLIVFILILSANLVAGSDIEWDKGASKTLYEGGVLTYGEYTIKVRDFSSPAQGIQIIENGKKKIIPDSVEPAVHIEIYKDDKYVKDIFLNLISSSHTDVGNEYKITMMDISNRNAKEWIMEYYKPWAKILIQKRGVPAFEVKFTFTPEKKNNIIYTGDIFTVNINMKNTGYALTKNIDADLDTGPLKLLSDNPTHQYYNEILKDGSRSFDTTLKVPEIIEGQTFNLSLIQKFYDDKGHQYNSINSTQLTISPRLINIDKSMRDRVYLKDDSMVRLVVTNVAKFNIYNIQVEDGLNGYFVLKSGTSYTNESSKLRWNIPSLRPGEDWSTTYYIRAVEANIDGFDIPLANATFLVNNIDYNISSQKSTVVVNGPKIILNKTVSKQTVKTGDTTTVNVTIKNAGNIGARIDVKDSLPENVVLKEGILSLANWSAPGSVQGFSYSIRMNKEGTAELPAVIGNYTDVEYRGTVRSVVSSDKVMVTVVDPKMALPTPEQTPIPEATIIVPGFGSILAVIAIIVAVLIDSNKRNSNKRNSNKRNSNKRNSNKRNSNKRNSNKIDNRKVKKDLY